MSAVSCGYCGRAHLVSAQSPADRCPFCQRGPLRSAPIASPVAAPEKVVAFSVSPAVMRARLEQWTRGLWLRPPELKAELLATRAQPTWVPMWLVDARVRGEWRAEIGFDYEVVSSVERYGEGQGWRSQQVIEPRIRWEPRIGRVDRLCEDVAVPALDDHGTLPISMRRYDLSAAVPYRPELVGKASVRIPTLEPALTPDPGDAPSRSAWPEAERAIQRATESDCLRATGGQHIRAFALQPRFTDLAWRLLLLPAYVSWYTEGGQVWPVFINGQTGEVSGARRASGAAARTMGIVIGAIGLALLVLGVILVLVGLIVPPVAVVGVVLGVLGAAALVLALLPPLLVRAHNRRETAQLPPPLGLDRASSVSGDSRI